MWASTNVKNAAYPDTLYVDSLIGPNMSSFLFLKSHPSVLHTPTLEPTPPSGVHYLLCSLHFYLHSKMEFETVFQSSKYSDDELQILDKIP
ncbi:hypothetical protein PIB30_041014 [Stylosanthes scabra]|uniref:Uncharacterized protein n=1 Tax=Stylosanthes scabra TaxID=79078 RepID=A0ABU6YC63_9FABA|nr:hypothetical protein [Stylosanthes scabra]